MKKLFLIFCTVLYLYAQDIGNINQDDVNIIIEDTSGITQEELKEKAEKIDANSTQEITIQEVFKATDNEGNVDITKLQSWEDLTPTANNFDWVRTRSGEWFKGTIEALYDYKLEFDSEEMGLHTFDFEDITHIKSNQTLSVNIEGLAIFNGIVRLKHDKINIIQGDKEFIFKRSQIVSLAPDNGLEREYWSGKISISLDKRSGNKEQFDYTATATIKRRTSKTRLVLDYLGRISEVNDVKTAQDHRINEKFDIYLSRSFFWTPFFSEFYTDKFQNIKTQYTAGIGAGYSPYHTKKVELDLTAGPAFLYTKHETVQAGQEKEIYSPAAEFRLILDIDISERSDFKYNYLITLTDKNSGQYSHHMIATLENEITTWLDFDISAIWDYIAIPERTASGELPSNDDYQVLVGLGVEF